MEPLTGRQKAIYDWLLAFVLAKHRQPTYREIGGAFGIASPNGVSANLKALVRKGWLNQPLRKAGMRVDGWSFANVELTAAAGS